MAMAASQSSAIAANSISKPIDFKNSQLKVTVWVEKGAHKVNVDSKGVILKGYDPVAYFTQNKAVNHPLGMLETEQVNSCYSIN